MEQKLELQPKPTEGIRSWYKTKTRKAITALLGATVITVVGATLLWILADLPFLARLQTFNGAITIPAFGGIWIASFMFIWLIPMREVSFRGQETMERMEDRLDDTMANKIVPAVETWQRVGEKFEHVVIPRIEQAVSKIEKAADNIERKAVPVLDVGRRLEASVEAEIQTGLLQELRTAAQSIQLLVLSRGEKAAPPPDIGRTLESLGKSNGGQR